MKVKRGTMWSCVSYRTLFVYQATAEQIRLAQVIYDKNDADFEDKVKQVMCICTHLHKFIFWVTIISCFITCFSFAHWQLIEVTGKTQDECMVALHDCNEDVNRAINFLLESTSDTVSLYTHAQTMFIYTHTHTHGAHVYMSIPQTKVPWTMQNFNYDASVFYRVNLILWLTSLRTPGRLWGRSGALGKKEDPQR